MRALSYGLLAWVCGQATLSSVVPREYVASFDIRAHEFAFAEMEKTLGARIDGESVEPSNA